MFKHYGLIVNIYEGMNEFNVGIKQILGNDS